jgi:surface carbohydrate biosynthesis protein
MNQQPRSLIVPVENQVRELDPKLLVACVAAERGFRVFLGSRTRIDFRIASFPRSFYLAKGMTPKSAKMFRIMRRIGHEIAALDEEGLVYHSASEYYARRVSDETLQLVSTLFAWGDAGAELLRKHRAGSATPVRVTGNPRIDLLRPELRTYFAEDAARIRARHGPFVLINTNFSKVNAYFPKMNLLVPPTQPGRAAELGAAGIGLPREFAEGLAAHKRALFEHFRAMIPALHAAFPGHRLIVRPHPSENRAPWQEAVSGLERADVIHEGNVIAWLEASSALIHNGCTTGIEAFCLGKPAIAYRPVSCEPFDLELPNALSRQCVDLDTLTEVVASALDDKLDAHPNEAQQRLVEHHIAARDGELAADRIVAALVDRAVEAAPPPSATLQLRGRLAATTRSLVKRHIKARIPQHRNNPDYQRNRYQGVSEHELEQRIARLGSCLNRFEGLRVKPFGEHIHEIQAASPAGNPAARDSV